MKGTMVTEARPVNPLLLFHRTTAPGMAPHERLDSWKEIAGYFRRSVRCVQRWEKAYGLPVHRRFFCKGVTVYACASELEIWWSEGKSLVTTPAFRRTALDTRTGSRTDLAVQRPHSWTRPLNWIVNAVQDYLRRVEVHRSSLDTARSDVA